MKAVILAGGYGTRLREETEFKPKPMVEIGERPIIWHIMKNLSMQGMNDFVLCLGYKGEVIKDYFLNYEARTHDVTVKLGINEGAVQNFKEITENWSVTLANTGLETLTGGRLLKIKKYVGSETFLCTYGDGLADIDLNELISFHKSHGKIATVTAVRPTNRFGAMQIDQDNLVTKFTEKPQVDTWVNGGFFVFNSEIFSYLDLDTALEKNPLEALVQDQQIKSYKHNGFWQPMDTYREVQELNKIWLENSAPWKNW